MENEISEKEIEAILEKSKYGDFQLTNAVRPYDDEMIPKQGYKHLSIDHEGETIPVVSASVSAEHLMDVFMEIIELLGPIVDVVLETSHDIQPDSGHKDLLTEELDSIVFKSTLWDYEHLLLNDGCLGVAIYNSQLRLEIQFDEHKIFNIYYPTSSDFAPFKEILNNYGVQEDDKMLFITDVQHMHATKTEYEDEFEELRSRLGCEEKPTF